ncbi:MAG: phage integrase SAM-like domain-containing protein, partial [Atopobiaceae bacterium]|nr:phage integrase SAM-like domain-containing protein [Atopobiaceae bacterium]
MNVYARKRHGVWNIQVVATVNGKRVERWHRTDVPCNDSDNKGKQKALRLGREWAEGIEDGLVAAGVAATKSLHEYCVTYIDSQVTMGQIEPSTRKGYNTYLNYIEDYFGEKTIVDVTASDVEGYIVWLRDGKGLCANSVKKAYNILKGCMKHAVIAREIRWNPCDAIPAPRQEKVLPNPLTEKSRQTFLGRMSELPLTPEVMGIWICYYTGCRRGEACHLRWRDVTYGRHGAGSFAEITGSIGDAR